MAPVTLVWSFTCRRGRGDPWCNRCPPHPPQSLTLPATDWLSRQGRLHSVAHRQGHSPVETGEGNLMWEKITF